MRNMDRRTDRVITIYPPNTLYAWGIITIGDILVLSLIQIVSYKLYLTQCS